MAESLTALVQPLAIHTPVVLAATYTRFDLPSWARKVTIYADGAEVKFFATGTDAGAVGTAYIPIAAGETLEIRVAGVGRATDPAIYLAGVGATARLMVEAH